jgi:hypothetical protein
MKKVGFLGEFSNDMRPGEDISQEYYDKVMNHCASSIGLLIIDEALGRLPNWRKKQSNTRQCCQKNADGSCRDPSRIEGKFNAKCLNLVAFAHIVLGVKFYYLGMGGSDGMKNVTNNLIKAYFASFQTVCHTSYITR